MQYYNYKAVGAHINDLFPDLEYDEQTLMRWCATSSVKLTDNYFLPMENIDVKIENCLGELPCDVWRVKCASQNRRRIKYTNDRIFIRPETIKSGTIQIDYEAIPLDTEGLPVVHYNMIEALAWDAIYKLYQQKFMAGEVHAAQWQHIEARYEAERMVARYDRTHESDDDRQVLLWIQRNVIWKVDGTASFGQKITER